MVGAWAAVTAEELALALAYRARRVVLVVVVHALVARRCLLVLVRAVPAAPALAPPITPAVVALAVVVLVGLQRVLLVAVVVVTIAVRTLGPALLFLLLVILVVLLSAPPLLRRSHRLTLLRRSSCHIRVALGLGLRLGRGPLSLGLGGGGLARATRAGLLPVRRTGARAARASRGRVAPCIPDARRHGLRRRRRKCHHGATPGALHVDRSHQLCHRQSHQQQLST